jgi:four helix bundle protein
MKNQNLIDRTKRFAHRCVKLATSLSDSKLENHIQSQLIRCSTSVAANYRAANIAQSRASFTAKVSIVLEEKDESAFRLDFISDENLLSTTELNDLQNEAKELTAIFVSSRKTARENLKK